MRALACRVALRDEVVLASVSVGRIDWQMALIQVCCVTDSHHEHSMSLPRDLE
jgi:hypothetical protein